MGKKETAELPPDIEDYLESQGNTAPVQIPELDELVDEVTARTSLDQETAAIVVRSVFQEIRNAMLRGEKVVFRGLGEFYVASPKQGNKERVFPKFRPYKSLTRKMNDR
jgi:nucleoid DNA-binding protein